MYSLLIVAVSYAHTVFGKATYDKVKQRDVHSVYKIHP